MSGARGKAIEFDPAQVAGLDDSVWQKRGTSTDSMGVVFSQRGEVVKSPGIAPLFKAWAHRGDKGLTPVNPFAAGPVVSIGSFQRDGATDILLDYNGGIYILEGDTTTKLIGGRYIATTPSEGSRFIQSGGILIIVNGKDPNIKWDGVKITPLGIATPPNAPIIAETDPGSGAIAMVDNTTNDGFWTGHSIKKDGTAASDPYIYKMVWVNDAGQESEASHPSNKVSDDTAGEGTRYVILVTNLSGTPPSDDITGRVLYRSSDETLYTEIAYLPGTSTDTYFDYIEHEFAMSAEFAGTGKALPPPLCKWAFEFRGRTYYGSAPDDPLTLFYSQPLGAREAVALDNYIAISSDGSGDEITGYGLGSDYALIFTRRSTHMLTHSKAGEPIMTPVSRNIGAMSDRAVVSFGNRIFFVGEDGMFAFDGSKVIPLSPAISEQVKNLPSGYLEDVVAWADPRERRIYFSVVNGASSSNSEVWSVNVDGGAVSKVPFPVTSAVRYKGDTIVGFSYTNASGSTVYDLGVWGTSNSLGASPSGFEGSFETRWITGKNPQSDKTYFRLDVFYVQTANKSMEVSWQTDWNREVVGSTTFTLSDPSALTWDEVSGGSTMTWDGLSGVKTWDEARVRCKRVDLGVTDSVTYPSGSPLTAKSIKLNFSTTADKSPWKLVGFVLHFENHGVRAEGTDS